MYCSLKTLKVSRRYFLPRNLLAHVIIIWNICGIAESHKIIENGTSSQPYHSSPLLLLKSNASSSSPPSFLHELPPSAAYPRFSSLLLNKIKLHNESSSHVISQLSQTGTVNLHKLLQKLKKLTSNPYNHNNNNTDATSIIAQQYVGATKVKSGKKLLGVNKLASSIPSYITNNTRLKRQLEGIFHVRGTIGTTTTPPTTTTSTTTRRPTNAPSYDVTTTTKPFPKRMLRYKPPSSSSSSNGSIFGGGGVVKRIRKLGHGRENSNGTKTFVTTPPPSSAIISSSSVSNINPKKEIIGQSQTNQKNKEDQKIATITNFHSKKSNSRKIEDADLVDVVGDGPSPQDLHGKRNFSVEIVEIARKTVIKEDNNDSGKYRPNNFRPLFLSPTTTTIPPANPGNNEENTSPVTNFKNNFFNRPTFRPRTRISNFVKPGKIPVAQDSTPVSANQPLIPKPSNDIFRPSVKYKPGQDLSVTTISSASTERPILERSNNNAKNANNNPTTTSTTTNFHQISSTPKKKQQKHETVVEVKVNYQEQIPYNDRDVDEADLQDYLDGHSTFGSKGNFKHIVSKNVTGYLPNSQDNTKAIKHGGLNKKQPSNQGRQNQQKNQHRPSRSRESLNSNNEVEVEAVQVKEHYPPVRNNKAVVYTATGVPVLEALDQEDKNIYQYSGNKDKPHHHFPKLPKSTLDALYKQGHPAIAKAPVGGDPTIYQAHPLGEPYGNIGSAPEDYNPFQANPLVDEVPLKYDPESDRFYGNPTPDKEKLAQSNRPEPNRVQIETDQSPEYQEEEQKKQRPPSSSIPSQSLSRRSSAGNDNDDDVVDNDNDNNHKNNNKKSNNKNDNQHERPPYERVYEPPTDDSNIPADDYNERNVEREADSFIKDFVSLDNNFQQLPRPSADEESFKDLLAPEARDEGEEQYFEPDNARNQNRDNDRGGGGRDKDTSTRRSNNDRNNDGGEARDGDDDNGDDGGSGEYGNDEEFGPTGPNTEDFDQSYVDALKLFDDEIKQIQTNERNGVTTHDPPPHPSNPPSSTGHPLVITSPGPAVSYQQRNAPPPPQRGQITTPSINGHQQDEQEQEDENQHQDDRRNQRRQRPDPPQEPEEEVEVEEDQRGRRRGDDENQRSRNGSGRSNGGNKEEEEEEEEQPAEEEVTTPKKSEEKEPAVEEEEEEEEEADDKAKDADESQHVKIKKVVEVKSDGLQVKDGDKSGNLDEDISKIEEEWRRPQQAVVI